jgi:hypothetical protein
MEVLGGYIIMMADARIPGLNSVNASSPETKDR